MPSWKKVIISGSNAALNSLTVTNGITGSLFGTSSWAVNAQTASFITASNVYGPFGSNSVATASYATTASFSLATSANTILVINKSGNTISKGMVVHLTGSNNSSDTPYVITASYESDSVSANTLGIASETIAFNNTGYITTEGVLTGVDVTGLISGQLIYLGATGSITGSAPVAPLHSVRLGQVVRDSPSNNGAIYVRIDNGYELGELHDIIDRTTTSSYGDLLVKSGSVWTNSRQLTGSYGLTGSLQATSFTGSFSGSHFGPLTGTASYATQALSASFSSTSSFLNSTTNAFIQNGNSFGTTAILGTNDSQPLVFETNTSERMRITATGDVGIGTTGPSARLHVDGNMYLQNSATGIDTITFSNGPQIEANGPLGYFKAGEVYSNTISQNVGVKTSTPTSASLTVNGNVWATSYTGSLFGTSSWATNALTASFVTTAQTASFVTGSNVFGPFGSNSITSASFAVSSSRAVSSSFATTASNTTAVAGTTNYVSKFTSGTTIGNSQIFDNGSQVGIGTTSPNTYLGVRANYAVTSLVDLENTNATGNAAMDLFNAGTFIGTIGTDKALGLQNDAWNTGNHFFKTFGTTRMFISGSGNIGIRTTTPNSASLHVSGNVFATSFTGSLFGTASWATNATTASFVTTAQTASYVLNAQSSSVANAVRISDNNTTSTPQYVGFVGAQSGTSTLFTDVDLTYIPNTNTLNTTSSRAVSSSFAISSSYAEAARTVGITLQDTTPVTYNVTFTGGSSGNQTLNVDTTTLTYNPSTTTLAVTNLAGNASTATTASHALTASFVNTLNQNVLITGSATVGSTTAGPSENTLTLGARDSGGEGGQLGFNASGGTYTSASMIDNYQNRLRILRGTNAGSDAEVAWWSMHNKQMALPAYNSVSAFAGTATALLAVDTSGNVITVATGSGGGGSGTVTNVATAGSVNGITLTGGPITTTGTITLGGTLSNVQSSQLATSSLMIGNSSISLGATASSLTGLTSVTATSFLGTASWANNATTATTATNANNVAVTDTTTGTGPYYLMFADGTTGNRAVRVDSSTLTFNATTNTLTVPNLAGTASWATNASKVLVSTNAENVAFKVPFAATNVSTTGTYDLQQDSETTFTYNPSTNTLTVPNLAGTASWATNATSATTATSANTLTTTRTIWGQNFNGSANVTGNLTSVGTISGSAGVDLDIIAGASARVTLMNPGADAVRFGTSNTVRWSVDGTTGYLSAQGAQTLRTTTGNLTISTGAGNGNILLTPDGTGNVGVGATSPGNKLQISSTDSSNQLLRLGVSYDTSRNLRGGINWHDGANTTGQISTEYDGTMVSMVFGSLYNSGYNSNTLMTLRGNGNLGIGTTSPSQKLHVSGSVRIEGAVYDSSNSAGSSGQVLSSTGTGTSWITSGGGGSAFPYTGSALITGSLGITGSLSTTGSDAFINGVRVGRGAGSITTNTVVGSGSLSSITTGIQNTAIGTRALRDTSTGQGNVAIGNDTGILVTTGNYNTLIGAEAGRDITTGQSNTLIGNSLKYKPDGSAFNGSYTLGIGKISSDEGRVPHIWAPETVTVSNSTNTTILTVDPSRYSGFFLEYVFDDTNGLMRSGTIKAVFTSTMSSIEWSEVDMLSIGNTSAAVFSVVDNGSSKIDVKLNNTTGVTLYLNSTSRLILRQL